MDLATKLQFIDLHSSLLTGTSLFNARKPSSRLRFQPITMQILAKSIILAYGLMKWVAGLTLELSIVNTPKTHLDY